MPLKVEVMALDLTSGFTGQSTSRVGAALPGPYVQATGAPCVDVAVFADVDFESGVAEDSYTQFEDPEVHRPLSTRLLLRQEAQTLFATSHLPVIPRRS